MTPPPALPPSPGAIGAGCAGAADRRVPSSVSPRVPPPAAVRFADLERLGLVPEANTHANLQPDSAAFTVWNVPSLGPNPGLRMMGSVQARWQRDGNHWQLQAKQRLLLEECDRYEGEYHETVTARCADDIWRSMQSWQRTTQFLTNAGDDMLPPRQSAGIISETEAEKAATEKAANNPAKQQHLSAAPTTDDPLGQTSQAAQAATSVTVSTAGLFAVLGAISSHGPARCNVVNLDGLVHHDQQIVDTDLSDHTQAGEALRRVVRHGGCEHPWTYWLRADGCCVAACHISTVLVADPEAETRLNQRRNQNVYGVHLAPQESP